VPVSWDKSVQTRLLAALNRGVTEAGIHLQGQLFRNLSGIEGGGPIRRVVSSKGRPRWVGPGAPPGRFPFYRSGQLRKSAAVNPRFAVNQRITVGVNTKYARALEFGTRRMAARPFLRRTLLQEQGRIEQIIRNRVLVNMQFGASATRAR
jgi:phage gpG-like protein